MADEKYDFDPIAKHEQVMERFRARTRQPIYELGNPNPVAFAATPNPAREIQLGPPQPSFLEVSHVTQPAMLMSDAPRKEIIDWLDTPEKILERDKPGFIPGGLEIF